MAQKRQTNFWQLFLSSHVVTGIFVVVILFLAHSVYTRLVIERDMAERRAEAEAELTALEARYDAMQQEVEYLSNDRGIEAEMRRQFDVAREGEQVVILLDDESEGEVAGTATSTPEDAPWYQFWQ